MEIGRKTKQESRNKNLCSVAPQFYRSIFFLLLHFSLLAREIILIMVQQMIRHKKNGVFHENRSSRGQS